MLSHTAGKQCFRDHRPAVWSPTCRPGVVVALPKQPRVVVSLAAAAEDAGQLEQQQQQQQQQQQGELPRFQQQGEQYTRQRVRKLARAWGDSSSPNTGLVSVTEKSQLSGAAACVAADLETNVLTRVVPSSEALIQRAVSTIRLANRMLNQNLAEAGAAGGRLAAVNHTLVFQPVEVVGDIAAPPAMPEGAIVLYTSCLKAGAATLQEALRQRAAAAAAAAGSDGSSSSSGQFTVSSRSDFSKVAAGMSNTLSRQGWVELVCMGRQDMALPVAMQALVKLRRLRYGRHKDDATVVLLGDEEVLGPNGSSQPPAQEGMLPPVSLLVLRCTKNHSNRLLPLTQPDGGS